MIGVRRPHSGERARLRAELELGRLSIGQVLSLGGRVFRITGFDPVSVRPRRVYLEDAADGVAAAVEVEVGEE